MKIIRARRGEAPAKVDRIYVIRHPKGTASWIGAVGLGRAAVFGNSVAELPSVADAEAEAIKWARDKGATEVVIENDVS